MSMTARRSVPCWSRLRARLRRLPAMGRTIGTMSTVRSASVIRMRRSLCRHVRARYQAQGRDHADQARPASAADRRARSHGLATGLWLQLASLVEADIGRYKRVIGDALRSRTGGRQTTEVAIAAASLNRMLELGRPEYVRLT